MTAAQASDVQRLERALQLIDARLARSDLFHGGTVKVVPATANVGKLSTEASEIARAGYLMILK